MSNLTQGTEYPEFKYLTDYQQEQLDELVHDTGSNQASNAINQGEQIEYLLVNGWTLAQIKEEVFTGPED